MTINNPTSQFIPRRNKGAR